MPLDEIAYRYLDEILERLQRLMSSRERRRHHSRGGRGKAAAKR